MLINLRDNTVSRQTKHTKAVVPMSTTDYELRVVRENKITVVDFKVRIERARY